MDGNTTISRAGPADLDALATVQPNDQVTQKLTWSRKGGTSTARKLFTGPGVVTGSASVSFKVS